MKPLKNTRHEAFAQLAATGLSASEAYRRVSGRTANANVHSARWMAKDSIKARIAELQKASETEAVLDMQERRRIAAGIARDAQQRASDRIAAIVADAKLAGEFKEKQEHSGQIASGIMW